MENNAALGVKRSTVLWWKRCCDEGCTAVHNCDILPCSQLFAEMKDSVLPTFPLFYFSFPVLGCMARTSHAVHIPSWVHVAGARSELSSCCGCCLR